ncbi:MAG: DUF1043 domain-containing protein [Oceanospirillaceae bacterium]|uniref:YhcB family protein n=1 Tax=Marinobacterium litorale TaxID=404770 RepID=UPI00042746DB|nr:YhcB family protein [Marinobacterium litorale]MBT00293.1 DUF1043 domain-containing protein [Oceanospirillaceae bacterium]
METSNVIMLSLVGVAVGLVIGYLLGRGGEGKKQQLTEELDNARAELARYKDEVTEHFETTAELVNGLTDQYRRVHQHLATGAQSLCTDDHAGEVLQAALNPRLTQQEIPTVTDTVESDEPQNREDEAPGTEKTVDNTQEQETSHEPPRDWAPKGEDEEGTLSDNYGIKPKRTDEPESTPPADPATPAVDDEINEEKKSDRTQ